MHTWVVHIWQNRDISLPEFLWTTWATKLKLYIRLTRYNTLYVCISTYVHMFALHLNLANQGVNFLKLTSIYIIHFLDRIANDVV